MSKKSPDVVSILMGIFDDWTAPIEEPKVKAPSRKKTAPEPSTTIPAFSENLFQYSEFISVDTIRFVIDNIGNEILNAENLDDIKIYFSKAHIVLGCVRLSPIPVKLKLGSEIARATAHWLRYSK